MSPVSPLLGAGAAVCRLSSLGSGGPVDPYLFAINDVLGPIVNLTYDDRAMLLAVEALGVGSLRHPGGTVADYWDLRVGRYVGEGDSDCKGGHWNYCSWQERIDAHPPLTFTPKNFWAGVGSVSGGVAPGGPIWGLNVLSLSASDMLAQVDALKAAGVPVTHVEVGNELYMANHFGWKFASADDYFAVATPVIKKVRAVFPNALVAIVLDNGMQPWNKAAAKYAHLFDAVTIHKYSPGANDVSGFDAEDLPGIIAGWGDVVSAQIAEHLRDYFPGKAVWRTEFNYPGWNGGPPLPELQNGALHGIYWASNVLAAVERYNWNVPIRAVLLHALESQDGITWDADAGVVRVSNDANDVERVRINGIGQIFAHVSRAALQLAGGDMHPVLAPNDSCGALAHTVDGVSGLKCVQAVEIRPRAAGHSLVFLLLNKCGAQTIHMDASVGTGSRTGWQLEATKYKADDVGGWAPLPSDPAVLPWTSGPLSPNFKLLTPDDLSDVSLWLPPVSLTVATFVPSSLNTQFV